MKGKAADCHMLLRMIREIDVPRDRFRDAEKDDQNASKPVARHLKIYSYRNIVHFLKRMLQVVDNAVLLYFENDPLSPSF